MILGLIIVLLCEIYIRYYVYKLKKNSIYSNGVYFVKTRRGKLLGKTLLGNIFIFPNKKKRLEWIKKHEICHHQEKHELVRYLFYLLFVVFFANITFCNICLVLACCLFSYLLERLEDRANEFANR